MSPLNEHKDMIAITAYYRREAELKAQVDDLQRQLDNARTDWLCGECDGRGCEAMNQNTVLLAELGKLQRENAGMRELIVKEGYTITYFNDEIALYRDPWHKPKKEVKPCQS